MKQYDFLNLPDSTYVGNTIYKKLFYDHAELGSRDRAIFTENIKKITWLYCLKPETINIAIYKDELRDYQEIEVIEVDLNRESRLRRIAEIIMRTIPYPMLLIFKLGEQLLLYVAHQRLSQSDSSKNTIDEFIATGWLDRDSDLFNKLDIRRLRFTNLYTLYSDLVDIISIHNVSDIISKEKLISGTEARQLASKLDEIDNQIDLLRSRLKKDIQFNRKMELNIEIKRLERDKNNLLGGDLV